MPIKKPRRIPEVRYLPKYEQSRRRAETTEHGREHYRRLFEENAKAVVQAFTGEREAG